MASFVTLNFYTFFLSFSILIQSNLSLHHPSDSNCYDNSKLSRRILIPKRYIFAENSTLPNQNSTTPRGNRNSTTLAPPPPKHSNSTNAPVKKKKSEKRNVPRLTLGFICGAIGGILSGIVFSTLYKLLMIAIKGTGKGNTLTIFSPMIKKAEELSFLEKDDGLDSLVVIGKGGCGEVYKAELPNGRLIAIKKVIEAIEQPRDAAELTEEESKNIANKKMRQIRSEIKTVGQIRHRNLLPLLAHMSKADCHYLVYEYMKNGSLHDILKDVSEGNRELDWLSRHKIALGIVAGLEYLHLQHTPRIIHRDLKPANVLLDEDMEARISDFGLAKAMPEAQTHASTANVAGTVGYIAPEFYNTLKFTDKCDIFSFGVLLGSLVIGKLPGDEFFQNTSEMSIVKWMRNVMVSDDPKRAIDDRLLGNGYEEQMLLVLKIACFCTVDNPKERPNSKDVRLMLSQINH